MLLRALPVTTKFNQAGLGRAPGAVTISTCCPLTNGVLSGDNRLSNLAATQLLPISE